MVTHTLQRMSPAELREACTCASATAVVSYVLGYGYVDISVNDDGFGWPTTASGVDTDPWPIGDDPGPTGHGEPSCDTAYADIATIYEAAGLASRKLRGLGSHEVTLISDSIGRAMLDDPKIWAGIEALAAFLEGNYEGDGAYGALGDDKEGKYADTRGEGGGGLKVLKACGLTPTYWADEGLETWHARCEASIAKMVEDGKAAGYWLPSA